MKYGKKILLLPLILAIVLSLFIVSKVLAQNLPSDYDVTISPVFFDLSANPGDKISNKIRIRNNTTSPLPIKLLIQKMTGDANGELTLKDTQNDDSLSWIKFENNAFVAKPLEWTNVPFTIDIPKTAAFGYYFAISFTQDNSSPLKITGTKITGAAAVPILLNVRKTGAKASGKLVSFKADNGFYEYPPIKLTTIFANTGNVHIRPNGNVFIKDWLGRQAATLIINEGQGAVIPGVIRTFDSVWNDSFITNEPKLENGEPKLDKNGKQIKELKFRFDKILDMRIGRYTASALVVVSSNNRDVPFTAETSFWVFPWKVVGIAIIFVIFAGIGFFNTIKNTVRRILKLFGKGKNKPISN